MRNNAVKKKKKKEKALIIFREKCFFLVNVTLICAIGNHLTNKDFL